MFGAMGSPGTRFFIACLKRAINASAIFSSRMYRFAAMQHSAVLFIFPQRPHSIATSMSASSNTMKASLPPSSIVLFFRAAPASAATAAPALLLPVSATPLMRGSAMIFAA